MVANRGSRPPSRRRDRWFANATGQPQPALRFKGNSSRAHAPVRAFTELVQVGVGMADLPQVVAQVCEQTVGDMKVPPATGITDGTEVFDSAQLQPVVYRGSPH